MKRIVDLLQADVRNGEDGDWFDYVSGFLHPMEGHALAYLAAMGPGRGAVVEIGSYLGKSTSYLAMGTRTRGSGTVFAVDHFLGSPEHQAGQRHEDAVLARDGTLFDAFLRNMAVGGFTDIVRPLRTGSLDAAREWSGPIRLLFIDGDHSYQATRADFEAWTPHLEPGGLAAFHDVGDDWPGVTRFFGEVTGPDGDWEPLLAVGSLRVVRRRQERSE